MTDTPQRFDIPSKPTRLEMTTMPRSNEPENLRQRLLDMIAKMPKDEQADYKEAVDEMSDLAIKEGYSLLKSQLEFILEL